MLVKIHNSYRTIVAICDSDIIGKKFEEGDKVIDVRESFFKGEEKTEKEVLEVIEKYSMEDATFNIFGKKSIELALKSGIINQAGVKKIKGVPIALVLL